MLQCVIFKLGEIEYGWNILKVKEIIKPVQAVKLPNSPDYMLGVIELRDEIMPVVNLKRFLNLGDSPETEDTRIIILKQAGHNLGVRVDEVVEVLRFNQQEVKIGDTLGDKLKQEFIYGVAKVESRLIVLLDWQIVF